MSHTDSRSEASAARNEAERLVAGGIAALTTAAERIGAPTRQRGGAAAAGFDALGDALFGPADHRHYRVANESQECCRCPVCRAISAVRRPDPVVIERLATGAGDLAEGAVTMLRTLTAPSSGSQSGAPWAGQRREDGKEGHPRREHAHDEDPWAAATKQ